MSSISFALGADLVQVRKNDGLKASIVKGGGLRGVVTRFSFESRRRMMKLVGTLKNKERPYFLTLTYQDWNAWDVDTKRDLDTFLKRLRRKFPRVSAIWRMELQERGVPHFHFLLFGLDNPDILWFVRSWQAIIKGGEDVYNFHMGFLESSKPCLQRVETWRGVKSYVSKYMAKKGGNMPCDLGRWWGVFNRHLLPVAKIVTCLLSPFEVNTILRYMRTYLKKQNPRRKMSSMLRGMFLMSSSAVWLRLLAYKLDGAPIITEKVVKDIDQDGHFCYRKEITDISYFSFHPADNL